MDRSNYSNFRDDAHRRGNAPTVIDLPEAEAWRVHDLELPLSDVPFGQMLPPPTRRQSSAWLDANPVGARAGHTVLVRQQLADAMGGNQHQCTAEVAGAHCPEAERERSRISLRDMREVSPGYACSLLRTPKAIGVVRRSQTPPNPFGAPAPLAARRLVSSVDSALSNQIRPRPRSFSPVPASKYSHGRRAVTLQSYT